MHIVVDQAILAWMISAIGIGFLGLIVIIFINKHQRFMQLQDAEEHLRQDLMQQLSQWTNQQKLALDFNQQQAQQLQQGYLQQLHNTREVFSKLMQQLTVVDEAQKQMSQLSGSVLHLQQLLADKRSRGALGEMQLNWILQSALPAKHYQLQFTLSNQTRADSVLHLPPPVGLIAVDSKFPLENYQKMVNHQLPESDRGIARQLFKADVKKHILAVAEKYIVPGETADSAILFIPSESVFAEIYDHFSDLVALAYQNKVWMVSPTTLMAVLTTTGMIIKDLATQQNFSEIKQQLQLLGQDFDRFVERSDNHYRHLQQAIRDYELLQVSSQKITGRLARIVATPNA